MRDVVVVGGGPVGLAAAIAAAQGGLTTTVIDVREPPIDKACGEGLMPAGVDALEQLGIDLDTLHGRPFRGIRYVDRDAAGRYVAADGSFAGRPGLGIRRTALHHALAERAGRLGVELRWRTKATGLTAGGVETHGGTLRSRVVVGADGLHSRVRRWSGLYAGPGPRRRYGVRRHFAVRPWCESVEIVWSEGAEAYVTPVGENEVGVALLVEDAGAVFEERLSAFPELAERLVGAKPTSRDRGAGPFWQKTRGVVAGHVALIGDASGYLDPITGEGLGLGFRQALALADAIALGDLAAYTRAHAKILAPHVRLTSWLLRLQRRPAIRRRAIGALARTPDLFSRILAAHNGELPWRAVPGREVGTFARALVAAR